MGIHGPARRLWPAVAALLPPPSPRASGGRPAIPDERVFWLLVLFLRAGCSWAVFDLLLIGSDVSGRTVRRRLRAWRAAGQFETICERLVAEEPDEATGYVDVTFIRSRGGGSDEVGLTRHGKGSKLQVIVNGHSRPIAWLLVSANPSEQRTFHDLLDRAGVKLPSLIVADRAYDVDGLRDLAAEQGSILLVPHKRRRVRPARDQALIPTLYRERWRGKSCQSSRASLSVTFGTRGKNLGARGDETQAACRGLKTRIVDT